MAGVSRRGTDWAGLVVLAVPPASRTVCCPELVVFDFPSGLRPAVKLVAGFIVGVRLQALTITEELLTDAAICLGGARSMQICNPWHDRRFVVFLETRSIDGGILARTSFIV